MEQVLETQFLPDLQKRILHLPVIFQWMIGEPPQPKLARACYLYRQMPHGHKFSPPLQSVQKAGYPKDQGDRPAGHQNDHR